MPLADVAKRWQPVLAGLDAGAPAGRKLDAANAALPGRLDLTELSPELDALLARAAEAARQGGPDGAALREPAGAFIEKAIGRPLRGSRRHRRRGRVHGHLPGRHRRRDHDVQGREAPRLRRDRRLEPDAPRRTGAGSSAWSTTCPRTPATASSACSPTSTPAASPTTPSTTPACAASSNSTPFLPAAWRNGRQRARREEALPEPLDREPRPRLARLHAPRRPAT